MQQQHGRRAACARAAVMRLPVSRINVTFANHHESLRHHEPDEIQNHAKPKFDLRDCSPFQAGDNRTASKTY
jgi:hypothetical protein